MSLSGHSATSAILVAAGLILAALAGAIIPLASGDFRTPGPENWTPPPPTLSPIVRSTPTSTSRVSLSPTATRTPMVAPSLPPPSTAPTDVAATPANATPAPAPDQAPMPEGATPAPTDAVATPASATPAPVAVVRLDPLSLRQGPSGDATLIGLAKSGETFTVLGRSADDAWLKVCCVDNAAAWLAAAFVDVSAPVPSLPVVEP